jgi:hypothetical protein
MTRQPAVLWDQSLGLATTDGDGADGPGGGFEEASSHQAVGHHLLAMTAVVAAIH